MEYGECVDHSITKFFMQFERVAKVVNATMRQQTWKDGLRKELECKIEELPNCLETMIITYNDNQVVLKREEEANKKLREDIQRIVEMYKQMCNKSPSCYLKSKEIQNPLQSFIRFFFHGS